MKIVLAGKIGSGKTAVAEELVKWVYIYSCYEIETEDYN